MRRDRGRPLSLNDQMSSQAMRRIQELEGEVTRLNASYQNMVTQYERVCEDNSLLQRAAASRNAQNRKRPRAESTSTMSYASSEPSAEVTDYDDEEDENDSEEEVSEEDEEEDEDELGESEYDESGSEAETTISVDDRLQLRRGRSRGVDSSANAPTALLSPTNSIAASLASDESYQGMTSFQQQVEPVIEEYEKVVAAMEDELRRISEERDRVEEELIACRECARLAEHAQKTNSEEVAELRQQMKQMEDATVEHRELAAEAESAQSEVSRLRAVVQELEEKLESAMAAAAEMEAIRIRTPELRADHFAADGASGRATPIPHLSRNRSVCTPHEDVSDADSRSSGEAHDADATVVETNSHGLTPTPSVFLELPSPHGNEHDLKENPTAAAVLKRLRVDLRSSEQRANRLSYINAMLLAVCAYTFYWTYRTAAAGPHM
ncbi:hypothetical protein THASP1DRAFT_32576 [Thamnocephalis sphaerospora]|uniref:Uncharacterized protein n=1 Tax=Thamnocephalis sphaerospora TaxID=78915 RepID=A0A4P9XIR0_9FUNG|nr:hypothetical protein THASP1DRAFT_32576 [Thamnocephalis sphaerospora]|eukprot:RKP05588.1 hypothetical protein THASP1DRAFT_32576 [Thamnocephalis sphaerospora]